LLRMEALERAGLHVAVVSGVDEGDCSSRPEATASRNAFLAACGIPPARLARARQVHGTTIHSVNEGYLDRFPEDTPEAWPAGDGLVTDIPGIALGVSVADCVPLWTFDPFRRVLGMFHAGRQGTVAEIASAGIRAMGEHYGCLPTEILCFIGPSAGPCCYEVSENMAIDMAGRGFPVSGRNLNLWEANRCQLLESGVEASHIFVLGDCTLCGSGFHSYRKSGTTMRNLAVGML
jgi:polyphenol oxidase